jgi:hypothetical protein
MRRTRRKSSGWRPPQQRGPWQERQARLVAVRMAEARRDCDRLRLWRGCPAPRCRRVRGCAGDPWQCMQQNSPAIAQLPNAHAHAPAQDATAAAVGQPAPHPALSPAEAAAVIAASIAELPPRAGEDFEEIVRDGRIHRVPRRRAGDAR